GRVAAPDGGREGPHAPHGREERGRGPQGQLFLAFGREPQGGEASEGVTPEQAREEGGGRRDIEAERGEQVFERLRESGEELDERPQGARLVLREAMALEPRLPRHTPPHPAHEPRL